MSNYGDELSRLVVERVTHRQVRWRSIAKADAIAVGSIIDLYQSQNGNGRIWGSGIANPDASYDRDRIAPQVLSVRGPLTRDRLDLPKTTPLGDPGLLVGELWDFARKQSGLRVLVPHYSAYLTNEGRTAMATLRRDGYTIAPPNLTPEQMMDLIARAQFVASSGLHGVILSHALGTACALINLKSDARTLPAFKYQDFFASLAIEPSLVSWRVVLSSSAGHPSVVDRSQERLERGTRAVFAMKEGLVRSSAGLFP